MNLDEILRILEAQSVRCTYGALAEHIGENQHGFLNGRPMDCLHRWVVDARTEVPNVAYRPELLTEERYVNSRVLRTEHALSAFLGEFGIGAG